LITVDQLQLICGSGNGGQSTFYGADRLFLPQSVKVYFYDWIRHIPTPKPCTDIPLSHLLPHNPVFITIPVVRAASVIALDHPGIIILVHLAVADVFFIVLIVDKIGT
jgi:hypothetical protein